MIEEEKLILLTQREVVKTQNRLMQSAWEARNSAERFCVCVLIKLYPNSSGCNPQFLLDFLTLLRVPLSSLSCPFNTDVSESADIPLLSSSTSPSPRPLAHERGRTRPIDGRWGVCYARAPDPDTTQHTALRATTAGLECDLLRCVWNTSGRRRTWMEGCTACMSLLINCEHVGYFLQHREQHSITKQGQLW